eukprot:TRINITY_DN825_c0_g1_i5.p3 TRINITY_DN825_c0_g1~~TRINITY_DN825_c0_g1_i5.p3  ORF type:complete len:107 (+),score=22.29 TRINITY_DN825_c0_g1_i5:229-549(+)
MSSWTRRGQGDEDLRNGNDKELDALKEKIVDLKQITVGFHHEARSANSGMDILDGDMGGVSGAVRSSMRRINQFVESTGNPRMVYLVFGFTAILTLLYYVLGRAVH